MTESTDKVCTRPSLLTSKQLLLFGHQTLVFPQGLVLVSPQGAVLRRCLTCATMLRFYFAWYKHTFSYLVVFWFCFVLKDISFVLFAQLLAPHVVSLELVLHNAHAQSADFVVTHHTVKLGETVEHRKKNTMWKLQWRGGHCSRRQVCLCVCVSVKLVIISQLFHAIISLLFWYFLKDEKNYIIHKTSEILKNNPETLMCQILMMPSCSHVIEKRRRSKTSMGRQKKSSHRVWQREIL